MNGETKDWIMFALCLAIGAALTFIGVYAIDNGPRILEPLAMVGFPVMFLVGMWGRMGEEAKSHKILGGK